MNNARPLGQGLAEFNGYDVGDAAVLAFLPPPASPLPFSTRIFPDAACIPGAPEIMRVAGEYARQQPYL